MRQGKFSKFLCSLMGAGPFNHLPAAAFAGRGLMAWGLHGSSGSRCKLAKEIDHVQTNRDDFINRVVVRMR